MINYLTDMMIVENHGVMDMNDLTIYRNMFEAEYSHVLVTPVLFV